ncbi:hypothetical protein DWY69_17485, partial [Eisenbergiella massiliensis]
CCLLPAACCLLPAACCLLPAACCHDWKLMRIEWISVSFPGRLESFKMGIMEILDKYMLIVAQGNGGRIIWNRPRWIK